MTASPKRPVSLVTGAGRRIGAAIARDLGAAGFHVALHANTSTDDAEQVAQGIISAGGSANVHQADLTDMASTRSLAEDVAQSGPITLLVNNASVFEPDFADALDMDLWDRHFAVHLKAPALLAEAMVDGLPADETGLIVNIIDQRVWRLTPQFFSYTLSKSALWTATQTMAQSFAPRVRVNAIAPGPTLANDRQAAEDFQAQVDGIPLKRATDLADFGRTIRYLWDTPSVTGQMIALDGGQHLAWETPDVVNARE